MTQYFFPIMFIVGFIFLYLFIRKDVNEDKSMTKKGFIKLLTGMAIIFVVSIIFIVIMNK